MQEKFGASNLFAHRLAALCDTVLLTLLHLVTFFSKASPGISPTRVKQNSILLWVNYRSVQGQLFA